MAVFNGVWGPRNAGQNRQRLTAQTDQSPSSVGSGTSSVSLRLRVWYESAFSVSWNGVGLSVSGGWSHSGSVNISHGGSGGRTLIYDSTITVPTQYASTVKRSFTATTSGITLFSPSTASVSGTHTVAARPVSKPNAASGVSASRVSDSRQDVSWSASATSARPIDSQTVQRRETNSAGTWQSWKNVSGTLSGGARSWADTSTVANRQYQYRVMTRNSAGNTTSGGSSSVRTTPAAPTIGSAVKQADGSIRVGYSVNAPYPDYLEHVLQDNPGGTGWVTVATQSGSGALVHDNPDPAVTHRYRVATRSTYSNPGPLTSAYSSASNTVQLLAAPNAPTLRSPTGVQDLAAIVAFVWVHNPVDTTAQSGYELRYRVNSGSWTTLTGTTAETRTLSALGVSGSVEWQVRTRGAHPDWSPWSAVSSFTLAARPTLAINAPAQGTLAQSRVDLAVGYFQADGSPQSRVQAELLRAGVVVETRSWSGTGDTGSFSTALDDATSYTVRARAQAGNGLWSDWDEVTFTTDFPAPVPYQVEAEWDRDTGAVALTTAEAEPYVVYAWEGAPSESASTKTTEDGTVVNHVPNPSFENNDTAGWFANSGVELSTAGGGGVAVGSRCGRVDVVGESGQNFGIGASEYMGLGHLFEGDYVAVAVSIRAVNEAWNPEATASIYTRFYDANREFLQLTSTDYEPLPFTTNNLTSTRRVQVVGPAPADTAIVRVDVYLRDENGVDPAPVGFACHFDAAHVAIGDSEQDVLGQVATYFDGGTQSTVPVETVTVQRRDSESASWVTLVEQVDPGTTVVDPTPALGAPEYRAISHTSLPSSTTGPVTSLPWVHGRDPIFVNTGPDYSVVGKAIGRHANDTYAVEQGTFPAAGFDFPLAMIGDGETGTTSFTGTIVAPFIADDGVTTRDGWREILRHRQVVCYRDCQGRKLYGLLGLAFAQDGPVETVTITVDEVWHREGVTS